MLLVFVAVALSILRYTLPYLDDQKGQVETWLSDQYGVELAIGELSAGWSGNGPTLLLRQVELKQSDQSPIALDIEETQIELDFWGSVIARQIQSRRFDLSGLQLVVNLDQIRQSETDFPIVEALESLFLEQLQQFSVSNSVIEVNTAYDDQLIQIQHLSWVNRDSHHQGVGQLQVVELASNSAFFTLDLFGDKDNLNGTFYAKAEELDLSPWLNQLVKSQNQLTESRGNFVFWAGIEKSKVVGTQVELANSVFSWETPDSTVSTSILGGDLRAVPDATGWKINLDNLAMQTDGKSLITSWAGHIDQKGYSRFNTTSPVDVKALLPILPLVVDSKLSEFVQQLDPSARVNEVAFELDEDVSAFMRFSDLGWNQVDGLPGTRNLTGEAYWHNQSGKLSISGLAGVLNINNTLEQNIEYNRLDLTAFVEVDASHFELYIPDIIFESDIVSLEQSLFFKSKSNLLAISTDIKPLDIPGVKQLFPTELMGEDTRDYLVGALNSGNVDTAKLIWHGALDGFPYAENQGIFQASVALRDVQLTFDPGWPALTELDIDLLFENEGLFMRSDKGTLQGVALKTLSAAIPTLAEGAILTIDTIGEATGQQVQTLMMASNLADSVGEALSTGVNINNPLSANLNLHIPLDGENVVATGEVTLPKNDIYLPSLNMNFADAQGKVSFINDKVSFEGVTAKLLDQQVNIDFAGQDDGEGTYLADIVVGGEWSLTPLLAQYHPGLGTYIDGRSGWQAEVALELESEDYRYTVQLESDLLGVSSRLPSPFTKTDIDTLPLNVVSEGNKTASTVRLSLGDEVKFTGILPHKELQFSRAHLALGDSEFVGMGLGFSISADIPQLDFAAWYAAITSLVRDIPKSDKPVLSEPQRIYVDVDTMLIAGQRIDKLQLVGKHSSDDWLLEFNSDQARAEVVLHYDWLNEGIEVKADFIDLAEWNDKQEQQTDYIQPDMSNLPPVSFECKQCRLQGKDLGRIDFTLSRANNGMKIDSLRVNNSNGLLYATGDWYFTEEGSNTRLIGDFSSPDFGALVKGFGFDAGIKDSKASFEFDLSWRNAPYSFNTETLNGLIDWRLTDGYISELTDKGARIFSIFSLQSLVRKLSLDFRDVFAKGFFYNKMKGSFQINDGRAFTEDTVIDGGAGEMTIAGYTDLPSQELNYHIGFAPNVTSSLPLLVYFMVNPGTAIAALAIDQVLTEAKVISYVEYSLTGTISEPIATPLDRKSKEISLPAQNEPVSPTPEAGQQNNVPELKPLIGERVTIEVESD